MRKLWRWSKQLVRKWLPLRYAPTGAQPAGLALSENDALNLKLEQAVALIDRFRPELVVAKRYLVPSAHKLYDFREEAGFSLIAREAIDQGRTLLDYNRLLTLWQAVQNTWPLGYPVAEVGTFRGGSAWFLAAALRNYSCNPPIHVFDTFTGHPNIIDPTRDGPHVEKLFADTSAEAVQLYLSEFPKIEMHVGAFADTCGTIANNKFALVHIDVDLFRSTVQALAFFWPRMVPNGVIIIDDYGFSSCVGLKEAVDQFVMDQDPGQLGKWYIHTGQFVLTRLALDAA